MVDWAENGFVMGSFSPDEDIDLLVGRVVYLAGADTELFPLTWDVISEFMQQLGAPVRVALAGVA